MRKVAIYGGAFNPPTLGHEHIIKEIFNNTDIEKIIITPDGFRLDKSYNIDESDRIKMINLFIDGLKNKGFNVEIDEYFLLGKNKSDTTTYEVDKYFINKCKFQPYHIFGTDVSGGIKDWSGNPDKYIEKKLKKIFVPRKGNDFVSDNLEKFELIQSDSQCDISSTQVRYNCKNNISIEKLVTENIKKYIEDNYLYK